MKKIITPDASSYSELLKRPVFETKSLNDKVQEIINQVIEQGDDALFELAKKFDKVSLSSLVVSEQEIEESLNLVSDELKSAIQTAHHNIKTFHESQREISKPIETQTGVLCWRKSTAIQKVGLYIPGGTAPLFSTVLMLATPAKIAGCQEIILCSPPNKEGKIHPAILYAAQLVGVHKIFKIGGSQAIAAMAHGTQSVPKVYKILGPGNQFVTAAKMLVQQNGTAIDMPAGPSEVMIVADESSKASYIAADMLAQAEHGVDSQAVLVCSNQKILDSVEEELEKQLAVLPRKEIASQSIQHSLSIVEPDRNKQLEIVNHYAPEHLILSIEDVEEFTDKVVNAGSIFIGNLTPESLGDYASGTNHTLPTNGFATAYSGVSLDTFVKKITIQKVTKEGLKKLGPQVEIMAEAEELIAHKNAVSIRLKDI